MTTLFSRIVRFLNAAGVVWVFGLMFLICADIAGRTLFDQPIAGVTEMVSMSLVATVFMQLAHAVQAGHLTRTAFLTDYLGVNAPGIARGLILMASASGVLVFGLVALGTWPDLWTALRTNEFVGVEGIYTMVVWPIRFFIVVGALLAAISCGLEFRRSASEKAAALEWRFFLLPLLLVAGVVWLQLTGASDGIIGISMIIGVLILIVTGMPIAVALLLTGFTGIGLMKGDVEIGVRTLGLVAQGTISEYVFVAIPLFVLMGLFVSVSGIGRDSFRAAERLFGRVRGGLGISTVVANAVFAAITGISIASAAIFSKIAVPEMVRQGYDARFAVGITAGSSVLGMLIPPSLLLIIYGLVAEVSIGGLFLAAIIPGLILAGAFAVGIVTMATFWPSYTGKARERAKTAGEEDDFNPLVGILPVATLILLVLGGIYGGVFTPTEAGAAGAFAAMLLALGRRTLNKETLWEVVRESGQVSVTILLLIISASTFSRMLTLTGLPQELAAFLADAGLGLTGFLLAYLLMLVILGMVLDSTSILLILLPLMLPVVSALGGDLIWFGVVTVIGVEIGLLTPPLGLSVYIIKSSLDDDSISLGAIFYGSFPFVLITLAVTLLLIGFPELTRLLR